MSCTIAGRGGGKCESLKRERGGVNAESGFSKNEKKGEKKENFYIGGEEKGPRPFPPLFPQPLITLRSGLVRINLIASRAELSRQDSRWL